MSDHTRTSLSRLPVPHSILSFRKSRDPTSKKYRRKRLWSALNGHSVWPLVVYKNTYMHTYFQIIQHRNSLKLSSCLGAGVSRLLRQLRAGVRLHGQVRRAVGCDQWQLYQEVERSSGNSFFKHYWFDQLVFDPDLKKRKVFGSDPIAPNIFFLLSSRYIVHLKLGIKWI